MSLWPPGSERIRLSDIPEGTEVLRGTTIKTLDRWEITKGGLFLVFWRGQDEPAKFQEEPVLTVWDPKKRGAA